MTCTISGKLRAIREPHWYQQAWCGHLAEPCSQWVVHVELPINYCLIRDGTMQPPQDVYGLQQLYKITAQCCSHEDNSAAGESWIILQIHSWEKTGGSGASRGNLPASKITGAESQQSVKRDGGEMYRHQLYIFKQINEIKPTHLTSCVQQPITKQNKKANSKKRRKGDWPTPLPLIKLMQILPPAKPRGCQPPLCALPMDVQRAGEAHSDACRERRVANYSPDHEGRSTAL